VSRDIEINPKNFLAFKWIAISYFNDRGFTNALKYLPKAYEYYPDDVDRKRNLMICYYKLNDFSNTEKFSSLYSKSNN